MSTNEHKRRVTEIGHSLDKGEAQPLPLAPVADEQLDDITDELGIEADDTSSEPEAEGEEKKTLTGRWLIETILLVGLAFVLALGIRHFLVEPYRIPSGSMLPTIQLQDQVLANKLVFRLGGKPRTGDIIVFNDPTGEYDNLIKRVIATEGQIIDLNESGQVIIGGEALDEPYVHGQPTTPLPPDLMGPLTTGIEYPFTVPAGTVWVMGDNRQHSSDSRAFGPVSLNQVTGRAFFTYWPLAHFAPLR